jgi:hypothetical protein
MEEFLPPKKQTLLLRRALGIKRKDIPEAIDRLEEHREMHRSDRKDGRITFDCYNCKVGKHGQTYCSKGKPIRVNLVEVLDGKLDPVCSSCLDYDDGGKV